MISLREVAFEALKSQHETGWTLEGLMKGRTALTPGNPSVWVVIGAARLYVTRDGSQSVKLKAGQIGVAFHYPDGRHEHGVFDVQELWEEVTGVRARQLCLWPDQA